MSYDNKTSAELEREVEQQRKEVEERIGEIKSRLSPGQLLDEALSYTKHGGSHFAGNLGQQISSNPLPAALVGIGLAWLMSSKPGAAAPTPTIRTSSHADRYPYANISSGGIRRVRHQADASGQWWSEFESGSGARYKAKSTSLGERAGHYTDEAGRMFSGFIDDAGNRVHEIRDEAGNMLSEAQGWANHSWHDVQHAISEGLDSVGSAARHAGSGLASGSRQVANLLDEQPLIVGALAFAAGAALGAALPHTRQEDDLVGEQADQLRAQAGQAAGKLYDKGKEQVSELYEKTAATASEIYDEARHKVTDAVDEAGSTTTSSPSMPR